jgi:CBS domain-containing protein
MIEVAGTISGILAEKGSTVWSIHPSATVFDAIALMSDKNVGALPVLDKDKLVGMLSERDYMRKIILRGKSSKETEVAEIMSRQVINAYPEDSVQDCMRVMTEKRIRHLPVLSEGKIVGMLSIGDLVKWVISAQAATIDHLEQYIYGGSLD